MKKIYFICAVLFVGLISACDGDKARKMLDNKDSPFGQIDDGSTAKTDPNPKENQKDDAYKAKPNGQPFGTLE